MPTIIVHRDGKGSHRTKERRKARRNIEDIKINQTYHVVFCGLQFAGKENERKNTVLLVRIPRRRTSYSVVC